MVDGFFFLEVFFFLYNLLEKVFSFIEPARQHLLAVVFTIYIRK